MGHYCIYTGFNQQTFLKLSLRPVVSFHLPHMAYENIVRQDEEMKVWKTADMNL